jgi:hypothetical protein
MYRQLWVYICVTYTPGVLYSENGLETALKPLSHKQFSA